MLVSPTEPLQLKELGVSSSVPEQYGVDYLYFTDQHGLVGVQRKELNDLVASQGDGRIAKEVVAMRELDVAIWLLEGIAQWGTDGQSLWTRTSYTNSRHMGFLFSLSFQGFLIFSTSTLTESGLLLSQLEKWLKKEKHRGIGGRPAARGVFGEPDRREWGVHFLCGLPGVGPDRAEAIWDHFGGLPFKLSADVSEVPGVGRKTAERIEGIFGGEGQDS